MYSSPRMARDILSKGGANIHRYRRNLYPRVLGMRYGATGGGRLPDRAAVTGWDFRLIEMLIVFSASKGDRARASTNHKARDHRLTN